MCDENLLAGMKMFRETLTFCKTSRKILDIYVSAALNKRCVFASSLLDLSHFLLDCGNSDAQRRATPQVTWGDGVPAGLTWRNRQVTQPNQD